MRPKKAAKPGRLSGIVSAALAVVTSRLNGGLPRRVAAAQFTDRFPFSASVV